MKKILACLLALMLPCCALADTFALDWTTKAQEEGMTTLMSILETALGLSEGSLVDAGWAEALTESINSLSISAIIDDSGRYRTSIAYQEDELYVSDVRMSEEYLSVTGSLFPGLLLYLPAEYLNQFGSTLSPADIDWENAAYTILGSVAYWIDTLDAVYETGSFAGEAYSGGTDRWTYTFDDRDIATLLDDLALAEWPESFLQALRSFGGSRWGSEEAMISAFRVKVHEAAMRNRYRYVLRAVGIDGEPIGISLLTYEGDDLVATLSMGIDGARVVSILGYGIRGQNVYLAMTMNGDPDTPGLEAKLWLDATKGGYYAASSNDANLLLDASTIITTVGTNASIAMQAHGSLLMGNWVDIVMKDVAVNGNTALETTVSINETPLMVSDLVVSKAEPLPQIDEESLRTIDLSNMTDEDQALFNDTWQDALARLLLKLLNVAPSKLTLTPLIKLLMQ